MKFFDRVRVATTTLGQATLSFGAATSPNMLTPAEAGAAEGDETAYVIEEGADFEVGRGVIGAGAATMTRATVLRSKIGGVAGVTKMSLAGNAKVRLVQSAGDINDLLAGLAGKAGQAAVDVAFAGVDAALAARLRVDSAQGLTAPQQAQGRTNLALGDMAVQPTASYVPKAGGTFTGLVGFDTPPTISARPKFRVGLVAPTPSTGMTGYVKMVAGTPIETSGHFASDRFTAPRSGLYGFVGGTTVGGMSTGAQVQLKFSINGALVASPSAFAAQLAASDLYWRPMFISALFTLSANDFVELWLEITSGNCSYGGAGGIFNGAFFG